MNTSATLAHLAHKLDRARYDYRIGSYDPTGHGFMPWDPYGRHLRASIERLERAVRYLNGRLNRSGKRRYTDKEIALMRTSGNSDRWSLPRD